MRDGNDGGKSQKILKRDARIRRLLLWTIAPVVVVVNILAVFQDSLPRVKQPSLQILRTEYAALRQLPPATPAGDFENLRKWMVVSVRRQYVAQISGDEIMSYYNQELIRNGWKLHAGFSDGRSWGNSFCKGYLQANVEIIAPRLQQIRQAYEVAIGWNSESLRVCK